MSQPQDLSPRELELELRNINREFMDPEDLDTAGLLNWAGDTGDNLQTDGEGHDKKDHLHHHKSSALRAAINTFISFVGAGILGIPYAFKEGGWVLSAVCLIVTACVCMYCMWLLTQCKAMLVDKGALTYGDVCFHALGKPGLIAVEASLVITQSGFSIAYLIFIAKNLHALFSIQRVLTLVLCFPGLLAETVNLIALAVVYFTDFEYMRINHMDVKWAHWPSLPFVMGVSVYCFEGMGMILTLEESMQRKSHFMPVLSGVISVYTLMCVTTGIFGYLAFGEETQDIILLNMGKSIYTTIVKLSFCVGLYFTFPVMMVPVWEVIEGKFLSRRGTSQPHENLRNAVRFSGVILCALVALMVPNFGVFISLIGAGCCSLLAFILPPLSHNALKEGTSTALQRAAHALLVVAGILLAITGTIDALRKLAEGGE